MAPDPPCQCVGANSSWTALLPFFQVDRVDGPLASLFTGHGLVHREGLELCLFSN